MQPNSPAAAKSAPPASKPHLPGGNPIRPGIGLCDPQVRVYGGKVYLYATHDESFENTGFVMRDWWIWSSDDLLEWREEARVHPEQTYHGQPSTACWATDAISRHGLYYLYLSMGIGDIAVLRSKTPVGPWEDPLGKPMIPDATTPAYDRDPGILKDGDNYYIVFGCWDYYIAKLNDDMISLAETPRLIQIIDPEGPYGIGKTDDKPYLHRRGDTYYLSWGCYYGMSDNPYGPYTCKGSFIESSTTDEEFSKALTYDRHGSFFELHDQWYFICNDQSYPGSHEFYRNSIIMRIFYRSNGEIEAPRISTLGVVNYDANAGIAAQDFFRAENSRVEEGDDGDFYVRCGPQALLVYPRVVHAAGTSKVRFHLAEPVASLDLELSYRLSGDKHVITAPAMAINKAVWEVSIPRVAADLMEDFTVRLGGAADGPVALRRIEFLKDVP